MADTLTEICDTKRAHVAARRAAVSPLQLAAAIAAASPPRGFHAALAARVAAGDVGLIAEIKKASPSKGLIRADFDPPAHARAYADGGAACLSVLTDRPFFQGDDLYLQQARAAVTLPVLRKDFMVDPWQVAESRALGADAILIIVAALDDALMAEIEDEAIAHGMDVLVEVHDEAEMARAARLRSRLIGVNNRNLKTFDVDVQTTPRLAALAPPGATLVCESGISNHAVLRDIRAADIHCFLVGESLMRQDDVAAATRALIAGPR